MHENNEHGEHPRVESHAPQQEGDPTHDAAFPGTESLEAAPEPEGPSAPKDRKASWLEKRKLRHKPSVAGTGVSGSAGLPWDLRLKIAVVASFVILVSALIANRTWGKKSPKTLPVASLSTGAAKSSEAKAAKIDKDNAAEGPEVGGERPQLPPVTADVEKTAVTIAENTPPTSPPVPTSDPGTIDLPPASAPPSVEATKDLPISAVGEPPAETGGSPPLSPPPDLAILPPPDPIPTPRAESPAVIGGEPPHPAPAAAPAGDPFAPPSIAPSSDIPPTIEPPKEPNPAPALPIPSAPAEPAATPPAQAEPAPGSVAGSLNLTTPPPAEAIEPAAAPAAPASIGPAPAPTFSIPNAGVKSAAVVMAAARSDAVVAESDPKPSAELKVSNGEFEPISHVVRKGENFWTIARYHYGAGRFYKALWDANRDQVPSPEDLYVGTALRIPPVESLNRALIEPAPKARETARSGGSTGSGKASQDTRTRRASTPVEEEGLIMLPSADPRNGTTDEIKPPPRSSKVARSLDIPSRTRVVRKHETVRSIARDDLGDPSREAEIIKLNQDLLDPEDGLLRLKAGMTLKLPDDTRRR